MKAIYDLMDVADEAMEGPVQKGPKTVFLDKDDGVYTAVIVHHPVLLGDQDKIDAIFREFSSNYYANKRARRELWQYETAEE